MVQYRNGSNTVWYISSLGEILAFLSGPEVVSFPRDGHSTLQDETSRLSGSAGDQSPRDTAPCSRSRPWIKFPYKQDIRMPNVVK